MFLEPMVMYLNTTIPFELPAVMFGTQLSEEGSSILFPPCVFPQYDFTHVYGNWVPPKIQMEAKVNHLANGTFMELRSRNESNTFKFKCEPTACSWGCQQVEKVFRLFCNLKLVIDIHVYLFWNIFAPNSHFII